uniref:AraC family ligand binding domain-containing protein n=1 Tax=Klebsiella aerogenes TaxID=548 RepID=UPI001953B3F3
MTDEAQETTEFWRHPRFRDLGLLKARFRRHRYDRHTHPTYVIALITDGCERVSVGNRILVAPAGAVLTVNPEEWHDGEAGVDDG